jgi:hypothetical protein
MSFSGVRGHHSERCSLVVVAAVRAGFGDQWSRARQRARRDPDPRPGASGWQEVSRAACVPLVPIEHRTAWDRQAVWRG